MRMRSIHWWQRTVKPTRYALLVIQLDSDPRAASSPLTCDRAWLVYSAKAAMAPAMNIPLAAFELAAFREMHARDVTIR